MTGQWESVWAEVRDRANDEEATSFEKTCTDFRISVLTTDGSKFGMRLIVETGRLRAARHDLYAYTLNTMVREIEAGLAREGKTPV